MSNLNNTKGCYIPSIEAESMYDMSERGLENIMKYDYKGMLPYSLELIKLRSYKRLFAEKELVKGKDENGDPKIKHLSDAVINIKFKNKIKKDKEITSNVRGYDNLMNRLKGQFKSTNKTKRDNIKLAEASNNKREIVKIQKQVNYFENKARLILGYIQRIQADKDNEIYQSMKADKLREHLYVNGFTFKGRRYVFYKRTASKSRQSNTLFILKDLYEPMKTFSHMGLDLTGELDVAAVLSYESLISSSIINTVEINPDNVFIIDDQYSTFECPAIEVGNDLKAVPNESATIQNNIWDGQALIDISLMEKARLGKKGSAQLRQAFFKCCSFSTNIQTFLEDKHKEMTDPNHVNYDSTVNPNYDEWKLKDVFGRMVPAGQILLISTISACKFLKFAKKVNNKLDQIKENRKVFEKWCKHIQRDKHLKNTFGICSYEKPSKYDDYSFTSYQMINTLFADKVEVQRLAEYEVNYIKSLQGEEIEKGVFNEQPFIDYLEEKKDYSNAYEMLTEIYKIVPDIVRTQMFRDYRTKQIHNYRTKVKGGKIRIQSQYGTAVSNPYEMLLAVINKLDVDDKGEPVPQTLQGDQIYTKLYEFDQEYTLIRNPHNAMNNYFRVINTDNMLIDEYFNFTKNIVVIQSIKCPILSVMNGMDTDGDKVLIVKDAEFNNIINNTLSNRDYPVIQNTIKPKPDPKELTNEVIADTDEKTAKSQRWIGEITNQAQYQVSVLWHIQNTEPDTPERQKKIDEILGNLSIDVVLSNVAIDYSKKVVEVNIEKALRDIRKSKATKIDTGEKTKKGEIKYKARKKPNFWKYVSSSDVEMEKFKCPMDMLIEYIDGLDKSAYRKNLSLSKLVSKGDTKGSDDKQIQDIIDEVAKFNYDIKTINATEDDDKENAEKFNLLEDAYSKLDAKISKKTIRQSTMRKIVYMIARTYDKKGKKDETDKLSGITIHLLNTLYRNHGATFLNVFKK